MTLDLHAARLHGQHHLTAQILVVISRSDREVSFLKSWTITEVGRFPARIPAALFRVDVVETVLFALIEANVIEDEELGFGAEVCRVRDARRREIVFGL